MGIAALHVEKLECSFVTDRTSFKSPRRGRRQKLFHTFSSTLVEAQGLSDAIPMHSWCTSYMCLAGFKLLGQINAMRVQFKI